MLGFCCSDDFQFTLKLNFTSRSLRPSNNIHDVIKLLMRQLWSFEGRSSDWDNNIPSNVKENWIRFFQELFVMDSISFKRCIHPPEAVGSPSLAIFSDACVRASL